MPGNLVPMQTRQMMTLFVAVASLLAIAGCTGEPSPIVTQTPVPTLSASVDVTPSAQPSDPVQLTDEQLLEILPPGAGRDDVQGAVVTAHFFVQEFPKLFVTGDFAVWDALSAEGCEYCANARTNVSALLEQGYVVRREATVIVEGTTEALPQEDGTILVVFTAIEAEVFATLPGEEEQSVNPEKHSAFFMGVEFDRGVWRVLGVDVKPAG